MTMSPDTHPIESKSPSRRALLAGVLGGLGAWAAGAIGRASPVRAEGEAIVVGGEYTTATSPTSISNQTNGLDVFVAQSSGNGIAVSGFSNSQIGVYGFSGSNVGVYAYSGATNQPASLGSSAGNSTGVQGYSGSGSSPAKAKTGVYGYATQDGTAKGVWGNSPNGRGVQGSTIAGYAGYFEGRVYSTQFYELSEIATPSAPGSASRARLFIRDSGGKTQLCVRFNTGAVKVLATES
jgi:hypothetical protein